MPKMDGIEMVKKIRSTNLHIPIIFTTAFSDTSHLKKAAGLSIDGYITKPIDIEKLVSTIDKTIKKIKYIYDTRVIVLSFMGVGTVIPLVFFSIQPYITPPSYLSFLFPKFVVPIGLNIYLLIIFMAIISTIAQWLLTKAYSFSKASIIGVVSYTNIPFAIGFGWLLGDNFPDIYTFIGIGLIVVGGILVGKK